LDEFLEYFFVVFIVVADEEDAGIDVVDKLFCE